MIDDHVADARGHAGVDDLERGHRGLLNGYSERLRQMLPDRPLRRLAQERHAAAQKVAGVEIAQQQVHVRARGQRTPLAVASRPRRRPGALRAHLKAPARVDTGDAAAAGAERADVDHRQRRGVTPDPALGNLPGFAVRRQGDVQTRAAHVDDRAVGRSGGAGVDPRGHRRRRRTRQERRCRPRNDLLRRHQSGRGVHDEQLSGETRFGKGRGQGQQVRLEQRTHVTVEHRGAHAAVVTRLRQQLRRNGEVGFRQRRPQPLRDPPLVRAVGVGVHEAHGYGLYLVEFQGLDRRLHHPVAIPEREVDKGSTNVHSHAVRALTDLAECSWK